MHQRIAFPCCFPFSRTIALYLVVAPGLIGCGAQSSPTPAGPAGAAAPAASPASTSAPTDGSASKATSGRAASTEETKSAAPAEPATVAEAQAAFDLEAFPLYEGAEAPGYRRLGDLSYTVSAKVADVYDFQRKKLLALGFKELPDGSVTEQSASGTFAKDGYRVSVSVSDYGSADGAGKVNVYLFNHGNVDPSKLPVPDGATPFYSGPANALFITEKPVAETAAAISKLFAEQGWKPYGTAGDTLYFKKNAVRVLATASSAPAQGGKTMISYSSEQMSADVPAPPAMIDAQYSDATKTLSFDSEQSEQELGDYYRETLTALGWTATTEKPVEIDWKKFLIFRNEAKDLLELQTSTVDGKTRAELKHQSAAEVAEIDRQVKEAVARRQREMEEEASRPKPSLAITIPRGAENIAIETNEITFTVSSGKATEAFDTLRKQLTDAGWKEEQLTQDANLGHASLKKDDLSVTITFVETGILPSELTITGFGIELQRAE